jgi:hypothetical protein
LFYPITVSSVRAKAYLREFASHERWAREKVRTSPCSPSLAAGASYMTEMDGVQIIKWVSRLGFHREMSTWKIIDRIFHLTSSQCSGKMLAARKSERLQEIGESDLSNNPLRCRKENQDYSWQGPAEGISCSMISFALMNPDA